jgi:hypothetical protein
MNSANKLMISSAVLLGIPTMVVANTGTLLMWAGTYHLLLGNLLIGIFEGLIIARVFGLKRGRCILALVLANYFSAFSGLFILVFVNDSAHFDINNAMTQFWVMVVLALLITIVLEWPFIAPFFRKNKKWFKMSVLASLLVQTLSYLAICSWYYLATDLSAFRNIVDPTEISIREDVLIYYIAQKDGDVYCRTASGLEEKVCDLNSTDRKDRLVIRKAESKPDTWELFVSGGNGGRKMIRQNLSSESMPDIADLEHEISGMGTWDVFSYNPDSPWRIKNFFSSLYFSSKSTDDSFSIVYEMPFFLLRPYGAIELPSGKVLLQLGDNQICIFDPETRQTALVAFGRSPIAILKDNAVPNDTHNETLQRTPTSDAAEL